jgi:hypothetical protein
MNDYGIVPILCTECSIHFLNDNLTNDWSLEFRELHQPQ